MPQVNPEILVWARETAGLTQETAATKLGFHDSSRSSAVEKLAAIEYGRKEPSRPQLLRMAGQYRRPLLTFYLSKPPMRVDAGVDFRAFSSDRSPQQEGILKALIRDIRTRQSMVRTIMEEEEEDEEIPFIDSHRIEDGPQAVLRSLSAELDFEPEEYRAQPTTSAAFEYLRRKAEGSGVFVLLKGDLGNYHSAIDTTVFRGFSIADKIAPFVVINDQDAKSAWSFTLLHETVHLFLGQTGISGEYGENEVEQFCDDIAGECLLPSKALSNLAIHKRSGIRETSRQISDFARSFKISRSMVAYRAFRSSSIDQTTYAQLRRLFRQQWRSERERTRAIARAQEGGPNFYTVRRHRLGSRIVNLVGRSLHSKSISTARASRILGVAPRQVRPLLNAGQSN